MSSTPILTLYAPLHGATFDSESAGLVGDHALLSRPFSEEWESVQKSDVVRERHDRDALPPLCITVVEPRLPDEDIAAAIARLGDDMRRQLRDAVIVLRLMKRGWFLDPELAEICFAVAEAGWQLQRIPGPYRQAFLHQRDDLPYARFDARLEDLTLQVGSPGPVTAIWDRLQRFRKISANASVEIALDNFNHSYGFQQTPPERLAVLFIALDAMLGSMSARRIGAVSFAPGSFRKRLEAALAASPADGIDARDDAGWLDAHSGGRGLRNAIAHGGFRPSETADAAQERLQNIVRTLLRQYIAFAIRWAEEQDPITARFKLPDDCPLAAAYNKVLEARGRGRDLATDLLQ